jgi:hypothetical protein
MYHRTRIARLALALPMLAGLAALSCDATRETQPNAVAVSGQPLAVEVDATPLDVRANWQQPNINTRNYTALVVGASGPFSYRWYVKYCPGNVEDYDCAMEYTLLADTSQAVTITVPRYSFGTKANVALEVKQAFAEGSSGADSTAWSIQGTNGLAPKTAYKCDMGNLGHTHPFDEWIYKPDSGFVRTDRIYRRNPCTGTKEFRNR